MSSNSASEGKDNEELRKEVRSLQSKNELLKKDLAEKSENLLRTESILAESQAQYKQLLARMVEMTARLETSAKEPKHQDQDELLTAKEQIKRQTQSMLIQNEQIESLQTENEKLKRLTSKLSPKGSPIFGDERLKATISRLRQTKEDILDMQTEKTELESQLSEMKRAVRSWESFSEEIFETLSSFAKSRKAFPKGDTAARQKSIHNLVMRVCGVSKSETANSDDFEKLSTKYSRAKESLKEVHHRCNRMLDIIGGGRPARLAEDARENDEELENRAYEMALHIKDLHAVTKRMKGEYVDMMQRRE